MATKTVTSGKELMASPLASSCSTLTFASLMITTRNMLIASDPERKVKLANT
jgi:hypothetical protein